VWPPPWLRFSVWAFLHKDDAPSRDDRRFKAFVIADPLTAFPDKASLRKVTAPILLWGSSTGGQGVTPQKVAAVADDLPTRPTFHVVPNSTHLSFIMPCPPEMAKAAGDVCVDPPGFDRTAFHAAFNAEVLDFFRKNLPE
jgi:predicted dienelactone hydrolase